MAENVERVVSHSSMSLSRTSIVSTHSPLEVPEPALDHLIRLTDDTGLFQHAKFTIPNRAHGYCTDDNARGVIAVVKHYALYGAPQALRLLDVYLAFLMHAQNPDGSIRNFLAFNRRWWEDEPAHDGFGRALWALGTVLAHPPAAAYLSVMKDCFDRATGHIQRQSNRGLAYCILGLCEYLKRFPGVGDIQHHIDLAACRLIARYREAKAPQHNPGRSGSPRRVPEWDWFEDSLTYDNAVLPHALFVAGLTLGNEEYTEVATKTSDFLLATTWNGDHFSFIGTRGWYERGKVRAAFDQQPVEAAALAMMLRAAYDATGNARYLPLQRRALDWLLGANDLGISLYDAHTKGCADGLMATGVNGNQGAESMVSFLLSLLSIKESDAEADETHDTDHASGPSASVCNGMAAELAEIQGNTRKDAGSRVGEAT